MRIASFNVENLFERAKALKGASWAVGRPALEAHARLSALLEKPTYTDADKAKIVEGLGALGLERSDDGGEYVRLRQNRGELVRRPRNRPVEVVADGRGDWIGWLELKAEPVDEIATRNTARVIADVGADVIGVVEAENRVALKRFDSDVFRPVGDRSHDHIMLIDGNDDRGIDVGLMTRSHHRITNMVSHVDDMDDHGEVFSRDCPEYEVEIPSGERILLLVNHLKSKGFGAQASSNRKRERQARRVRKIYDERRAAGMTNIAIVGDFNDTPDSAPLAPLLQEGSDLRDVSVHPKFESDGRPGTFGNGTKSQKIDYVLLSPELFDSVTRAGVFRKGVWGGKHGNLWEVYENMKQPVHAASDHAAIWADIDI